MFYECSNCETRYQSEAYRNLPDQSRVTDDPNDKYGVEKVCPNCDNAFFSDKWKLRTTVETTIDGEDAEVVFSTVHLIIPHGLHNNLLYETLIRHPYGNRVVRRYMNKAEAKENHEQMVKRARNGEFRTRETEYDRKLVFNE